ncbi:hypothetical protein C8R44DRAFT_631420, partial [Mycena epipterygia]
LRTVVLPQATLPRFLAIASANSARNLETCGLLLGREVVRSGVSGVLSFSLIFFLFSFSRSSRSSPILFLPSPLPASSLLFPAPTFFFLPHYTPNTNALPGPARKTRCVVETLLIPK